MYKLIISICSFFCLLSCSNTENIEPTKEEKSISEVKIYELYSTESKLPLDSVIKTIKNDSLIPILYFCADWCRPCVEFKNSLSSNLMKEALKNTELISIDVDDDSLGFNEIYNVKFIPCFVKIDDEGKVIGTIDGGEWNENIPENMAPVLIDFINTDLYHKD